jgi:hypothetical protein
VVEATGPHSDIGRRVGDPEFEAAPMLSAFWQRGIVVIRGTTEKLSDHVIDFHSDLCQLRKLDRELNPLHMLLSV